MLRFLLDAVGFNDAQRYVATLTTLTSTLAIFIARPNPEHEVRKPEKWSFSVFIDVHAFRHVPFMFLSASISFLFLGFYAVFFNLEEWAAVKGLGYRDDIPGKAEEVKPQEGAIHTYYLLGIMNGASTLGRVSSAYLCDHFGALNVHAVVTFVASMLILTVWTTAKTVPHATAFVVLFGIFSGAVIGLPPASVANILGPNPKEQAKLGQWTGMMYSTAGVFALVGPVIAGHLVSEFHDNFLTVQCWSGGCLLLSSMCMGAAIFFRRRMRAQEKKSPLEEWSFSSAASSVCRPGAERDSS
jgi:MFS transporter, MCT family, solute carrier family 16 (monocarboxylic acid transporters), member 10